jgi:tryptophan synthase alpha chain
VAVGFGISGPEQAAQVRRWGADGAIVGSALVRRMAEANAARTSVAEATERFCRQLRAGLDGHDEPHAA